MDREYHRKYYADNKERINDLRKEYSKEYSKRPEVKEKKAEYAKEHFQKNKGYYDEYYNQEHVRKKIQLRNRMRYFYRCSRNGINDIVNTDKLNSAIVEYIKLYGSTKWIANVIEEHGWNPRTGEYHASK